MKDWIEVKLSTTPFGQELAAEILYSVGAEGLYIEDPLEIETLTAQKKVTDWDYLDEKLLDQKSEVVILHAYLPEEDFDENTVRAKILNLASEMEVSLFEVLFSKVNEADWANEWKKYYRPFRIGKRLVVKPSWEAYEPETPDDCILSLDPGLAFGTGTHETTFLCMKMLEEVLQKDCHVLDIGCGSGILGIAALKLGAKDCLSVDLDPQAVLVTEENAERNEVSDRISAVEGNLVDVVSGQFDVILSNIVADAILTLSDIIMPYLSPGGVWISSGIIRERYDEVKEKLLASGFKIIKEELMGEWALVAVTAS